MEYRQARILGEGDFDQALRGLAVSPQKIELAARLSGPTHPRDEPIATRNVLIASEVYAAGDSRVAVFDPQGTPLRHWDTEHPGYSIALRGDDVWVGQAGQIEIFDSGGTRLDLWRDAERLGLVTAVGFTAGGVLAADAVARCIRHYDRQGNFRNNIGDRHRKGGFHIPNGVVDFAVDAEGLVHVANPGMHRVERYTPEGELVGRFGRFDGVDPEGFPGCCNPTNVTVAADGRVIVTEKAGPRAKVYDPQGRLLAVVAAGDAFDPAAKNMDVASDDRGNVYVADSIRRRICVFEPVSEEQEA